MKPEEQDKLEEQKGLEVQNGLKAQDKLEVQKGLEEQDKLEEQRNLEDLIEISREYGADPDYLLAGGGNSSFKTEQRIYVKASGFAMGSIDLEGFVPLERKKLSLMWTRTYSTLPEEREAQVLSDLLASRSLAGDQRRPSVETLLHEIFPYRYVVHTHPSMINGLSCAKRGREEAARILGEDIPWIPVIDPGYVLASRARQELEQALEELGVFPRVLILQNHGIFVASDSIEGIRGIYAEIRSKLEPELDLRPSGTGREAGPELRALALGLEGMSPAMQAIPFSSEDLDGILKDPAAFAELSLSPTPDHIVYCGYRSLLFSRDSWKTFLDEPARHHRELSGFRDKEGFFPRILVFEGLGAIACHEEKRKAELARLLFEDHVNIAIYARNFGGIAFMPRENIEFIRNWEVESFRASRKV